MSSQRRLRIDKQIASTDPINVTIIIGDGIRKVIPWEEFIKMPDYFPNPNQISTTETEAI